MLKVSGLLLARGGYRLRYGGWDGLWNFFSGLFVDRNASVVSLHRDWVGTHFAETHGFLRCISSVTPPNLHRSFARTPFPGAAFGRRKARGSTQSQRCWSNKSSLTFCVLVWLGWWAVGGKCWRAVLFWGCHNKTGSRPLQSIRIWNAEEEIYG